jgi:hypothetical protein
MIKEEDKMRSTYIDLVRRVADQFADRPEVQAVALGGSMVSKHVDTDSDIDLYVYTCEEIPLDARIEIMERTGGARCASMGLNFWGPGDEWFDAETGIEVDVVYFDAQWMDDQIRRVVLDHQASLGYSTCFWYTVVQSQIYDDSEGWFGELQSLCRQPYPKPLAQNIIDLNHPVLREIIPSYFFQIEKAVKRNDLVSVNHRLTGLLTSYFDIVFALNLELHPGEKRLVEKATSSCRKLPKDMDKEIRSVLVSAGQADPDFLIQLVLLLDHLDNLLIESGVR